MAFQYSAKDDSKTYQKIPQSESSEDDLRVNVRRDRRCSALWNFVMTVLGAVLMVGVGFLVGRALTRKSMDRDWFSPPGDLDQVFTYTKNFTKAPSTESNRQWNDLYPRQHGFIRHHDLKTEIGAVAVFHQLHCLETIWHQYYILAEDTSVPEYDPAHARHCIEYLRQVVMCLADTNLEPEVPELGGVNGFGFNRKCRDYQKVVEWADRWENSDPTPSERQITHSTSSSSHAGG